MTLALDLAAALRLGRGAKPRSLLEFARKEIVVPTGPFRGRRFDPDLQPFAGLLFREIDAGRWGRIVVTGPTQSGKTLCAFTIPIMWSLFELGDSTIVSAPGASMLQDKWLVDLLPAIQASRYASRMPTRGAGSDGGETDLLDFGGGALLRFMAGAGGDKARAGFTARCLYITETDGMDEVKERSREADPITQLEQRTAAYGARARISMECTVSTKEGRTWREWMQSTRSRIAAPCVHCGAWVCPEREHLVGWSGAGSVLEAQEKAHWTCPACAAALGEDDRRAMVRASCVLHHGQEREGDKVTGDPPRTDSLGFRWNAWHNLFQTTADIAAKEWRAASRDDAEAAEREMRQFVWALPAVVGKETEQVQEVEVMQRVDTGLALGVAPSWTSALVVGVDVGRHALHWCATAWSAEATGHTVAYGVVDVDSAALGEERAVLQALRTLRDRVGEGYADATGKVHRPTMALVDSGFRDDIVMQFAGDPESRGVWWPSKGRGIGQELQGYHRPKSQGGTVLRIGDHWHLERLEKKGPLLMFDANFWKSWLRARIQAPRSEPGAWTVHAPLNPKDHYSLGKHLSSERLVQTWEPKKGWIERWEARRTANHWWDALVLCGVAAGACGASATRQRNPKEPEQPAKPDPRRLRVSSPLTR